MLINGRFLTMPDGGVSRVAHELVRALIDEVEESGNPVRVRLALAPRTAAEHLPAGQWSKARGFSGRLGEQLLPLAHPRATIFNFCNVTPILAAHSVVWLHDTHVFDAPSTYPLAYRAWHRALLGAIRLRHFDVVTVSEYARERLVQHGVERDRIRVVPNGGDHILRAPADRSLLERSQLDGRDFALIVGSPARHKNVPFAVRTLLEHGPASLQIAVVGLAQKGPYLREQQLPRSERVMILPRVSDGQLRALYGAARMVIVPSLAEGFGLYAAEAMFANSGPLLLSNRGALPEVGGDAALYFDPEDASSLARAVTDASRADTIARLEAAARAQRERFRWRNAARRVIEAFVN